MADKPTKKPAPAPLPVRSVALPNPADGPAPPAPPNAPAPAAPPSAPAPAAPPAPAPVRDSLKAARSVPAAAPASPRRRAPPQPVRDIAPAAGVSTPEREVTVDDEVWVLRQEGAGCVGYDRDAGATILSIGLEPRRNADDVLATRYVMARSLDDVAEEELVSLVREVARAPDPGRKASPGARRERSQDAGARRRASPRRGPRR